MSRSIHTTRKHLEERRKMKDTNKEERRFELSYLKAELEKKRLIKTLVHEERHTKHPEIPATPESIPISLKDQGPYIHYPASPEDITHFLQLLPPGQINGLSSITLCLGKHAQSTEDGEPDPFTGRIGTDIFPGVFSANTIGVYYADTANIELFAYVYEENIQLRGLKETYLRLIMLSTLAHELAHHYDFSQRISRGRWRGDHQEKKEIYAEETEHQWDQQYVLPFMNTYYPDEVSALLSWIKEHGGVEVPLSMFLTDPRVTLGDGLTKLNCYSIRSSVQLLMEDIEKGEDPTDARIYFARNLHYDANYELARQCLAEVLQQDPEQLEALTLIADIDVHEGLYEHAEELCKRVIALDAEWLEAWEVLCDVYVAQSRWSDLRHATNAAIALQPQAYWYLRALRLKGHALLMLHEYEEAKAIIKELHTLNPRIGPSAAWELEAKMLLQQNLLEEALTLAIEALPKCTMPGRTILEAVRLDTASQLGRTQDAIRLSDFTLRHLRSLGFPEWSEQLAI